MHPVFTISEILSNILTFVQHPQFLPGHRKKSALPVLARTCKTFKDPALNIIWAGRIGLGELAHVLPRHALVLNDHYYVVDINPLMITRDDWSHLYTYTSRVRDLHLDVGAAPCGFALTTILASPPPTICPCAFPKLRRLIVGDSDTPFGFLLTDGLEDLDLCLSTSMDDSQVAALLYNSLPKLRRFKLSLSDPDLDLEGDNDGELFQAAHVQLMQVIGSFSQRRGLEVLDCPPLDVDALRLVGAMRGLRELVLNNTISATLIHLLKMAQVYPQPKLEFANLHSIELRVETLEDGIVFLQVMDRLPRDIVVFLESPSLHDLKHFFSTLLEFGDKEIKRVFSLRVIDEDILNADLSPVNVDTLRPLTSFASLERLVLNLHLPFSLTDADIERFARAWPKLHTFEINWGAGWGKSPLITATGLIALARHCPRLASLTLPIDASALRLSDMPAFFANISARSLVDGEPDLRRNAHLWRIDISHGSIISEPMVLALLLASLFANLDSLYSGFLYERNSRTAVDQGIKVVRRMEAEGVFSCWGSGPDAWNIKALVKALTPLSSDSSVGWQI
ncbi:hypothetical protein CONPUDRAFT_166219 [Coniophora puteana RWD-64-598 SS2]|uniref:F-box domain-containing protein n=1 Tax=Coniophora puteana (strain RWD-64-598) TaxID=741705 RepID=A0A5M3MNU4_CONPW|nr:uncharacterized protein CONPUDRAFT_166219 [Coniophora puteana RWD-64-598 SS2]EIW80828.1 hypothetical protein CONPUDRAFT_166219 [Coniophora puteana RWD-64-598 SS2]